MKDIIKKNMNTLHNMYMAYPDSMKGLSTDGNCLVYENEKIDISKFDIEQLFNGINPFMDSLDDLTADDIFRIIKIHVMGLDMLEREMES